VSEEPQLTEEDLKGMNPEAIVAAYKAGQLDVLMGRRAPEQPEPTPEPEGATPGAADQGARGSQERMPDGLSYAAQQRWRAKRFFAGKSPEEINAMRRRGELDEILRDGFQ
jgi:hypothetical protein